ncbi:hypothetical protein IFR05_009473 [Cadophora sp. M221]|nr:hypothetical protein IFR05_009473 [Cadophora sp. M221]
MADPLSTAGTAVGIVSLGLQISQGLITYYSHFKAYDAEIAYLVRKSESLQGLLQALEAPLRKAEDGNGIGGVSVQVRNAILACEAGLTRLLGAVQTYGNLVIPATKDDKLRALKKRALYPFKRSSLQDLSFTLEELVGNLQLALQILTLETSQNHKDTTLSMAETSSSGARNIITHFDVIFNKLESRLDQLTLSIQTAQSHSLLHQAGKGIFPAIVEVSYVHALVIHKPLKVTSAVIAFQAPGLEQRDIFHNAHVLEVLGYSIAATFSVARGAGAFAISPHFMLRAVVPGDSPAFRLLDVRAGDFRGKFSSPIDHVNWIIQEFDVLFRKGKASPTDVDPYGRTLLHMAATTVSSWWYDSPGSDCEDIQATGRLLDGILSFGADPLERDCHNRTIMDIFFQADLVPTADYHDLLVRLFDCGLVIENIGESNDLCDANNCMNVIQNTMNSLTEEQIFGILELPDLLAAVCLQDEAAMEKAFECSPESINQRHARNLTLLHLSISWSPSLSFLLAHGADTGLYDSWGHTPLYYACMSNYGSAISSLLDHDSPMGSTWDQNACLGYVCESNDFALQETFISHLANRRKRLLELALRKLPHFELEMLSLKEDRVLDAQAAAVTSALLRCNVEIDSVLMPSINPRKKTVYHTPSLGLHMAKSLYESRFRDIDEIGEDGWTPFGSTISNYWGCLESLETLQWLRDQGADAYRTCPRGGGSALHALGDNIGYNFKLINEGYINPIQPTAKQAKIAGYFLEDEVLDDCDCACSRDGCRIITSALRGSRNWFSYVPDSTGVFRREDTRLRTCLSILQLVEGSIPDRPWIPLEVIRVMTFEWLELTHTCHKDPGIHFRKPREHLTYEEIQEIHDEERDLLQEHENLVTEFEAKYAELGLPIKAFMQEYLEPRMNHFLEASDERSLEEERRRMREFGIVVEERDRIEELNDDEGGKDENEDGNAGEDSGSEDYHDCEDITAVS